MPVTCHFAYEGSNCERPATHFYRSGGTNRTARCDAHAFDWEPVTEAEYLATMPTCDYLWQNLAPGDRPTCGNEASAFYSNGTHYYARCWTHMIPQSGTQGLSGTIERISEEAYREAVEPGPTQNIVESLGQAPTPPGPSVWARLRKPDL